ncbi:hypothetical protein ACIBI9_66320 [Nonomuraea sp. NPDC050451]|uniref:hypothetical protein n=1 Tax=Nonomuraea sp. NPDC050451 TaxID=3364364 RepID=UPI0037B58EE1
MMSAVVPAAGSQQLAVLVRELRRRGAFNTAGNRLCFSSRRGTGGLSSGGITYRVTARSGP